MVGRVIQRPLRALCAHVLGAVNASQVGFQWRSRVFGRRLWGGPACQPGQHEVQRSSQHWYCEKLLVMKDDLKVSCDYTRKD